MQEQDGEEQDRESGDPAAEQEIPEAAVTAKEQKPRKLQDLEMVVPVKWEDWEISVKCSEEERTELVRELVKRVRKEGLKEAVAMRADCVLLAYATKDGIHVYDCKARRATRFSA